MRTHDLAFLKRFSMVIAFLVLLALGLILFAVGALIGCFVFMGTLMVAKKDKTYTGSIPM